MRLTLLFIFDGARALSLELSAHLVQQLGEPGVLVGPGADATVCVIHDLGTGGVQPHSYGGVWIMRASRRRCAGRVFGVLE